MGAAKIKRLMNVQKEMLEYLTLFVHPGILHNRKISARQLMDIKNNFININKIKEGLLLMVSQLNEDFSKVHEDINHIIKKIQRLLDR